MAAAPYHVRVRAKPRLLAVLFSILVAVATTMFVLRVYSAAFNTSDTELAGVPATRSLLPPPPRAAGDVVLIVVDGLGFEQAMALDELRALRRVGVTRPLMVDFPTFTSPAIVTMVTGLSARDHGLRLNGAIEGVPGLDTLLASAVDAGLAVRVRPRQLGLFADLLRPPAQADVLHGQVAFVADWVWRRAAPTPAGPRALWLVHIDEVDEAGHDEGSASERYREAARRASRLVTRVAADLDLTRDVLVVVSDHGHLPEGGHGGDEAEVRSALFLAAGAGVAQGSTLSERPMMDLASTLSMLAGIPTPGHNLGLPMLDILRDDSAARARALAEPFDQVTRLACRASPSSDCAERAALVERLAAGDGQAVPPALEVATAIVGADHALSSQDKDRRRWLRWAVGLPALGVASSVAHWRARRLPRPSTTEPRAVVAWLPLVYLALYAAVMFAKGYGPSFSRMAPEAFFLPDAAMAVALAAAVTIALARWGRADDGFGLRFLWQLSAAFGALVVVCGADPRSLVPPVPGVLVFQLAPVIVGIVPVVLAHALWGRPRSTAAHPG